MTAGKKMLAVRRFDRAIAVGSRHSLTVLAGMGISLVALAGVSAQQAYELSGGVIGREQVERGEAAYQANCSGCHGPDLRAVDSNAPDLRGPTFQYGWTGNPLSEKFVKIRTTMPPGMGGSLSDQTYADIMAFILATNGIAASEEGELPADADQLENHVITRP